MPATTKYAYPYPAATAAPNVPADIQGLANRVEVEHEDARLGWTGLRNRVINGDFRINQRGYVSGTALAVGAYCFDMWKSTTLNTALTFTAAPNGTTVTISSGGSIAEVIERANMPAGVHLVSWTGTATGRVYNSGAGAPAYAASPLVVTLDGLADVVVELTAVGGTKTLGTVQVEAGTLTSDVTPYEIRPLGMEMELCLRHFWRQIRSATGMSFGMGQAFSTTGSTVEIRTPVPMRAAPTITPSAVGHFSCQAAAGALALVSAISAGGGHAEGVLLGITHAATLVAGNATVLLASTAGAFLDWSAVL